MNKNPASEADKAAVSCIRLAEEIAKRYPKDLDAATLELAKVSLAFYIGRDAVERLSGQTGLSREDSRAALGAAFKRVRLVK